MGLRQLLGYLATCRNYATTGHTWCGGGDTRPPRIRGRLRRIFRKSCDFAPTLGNCSRAPCGSFAPFTLISLDLSGLCENGAYAARGGGGQLRRACRKSRDSPVGIGNPPSASARWVCSIYSDFSGHVGIRRKRGVLVDGSKYATVRPRGRLRRIFRISRDYPANLKNSPMAPARGVFAIYSVSVGIRRKRSLQGARDRNTRPPGPVADCVGSSGFREMPRRISETSPCSPRGGFAPLSRISRDLSELCDNGAYLARGRNTRPRRMRG